MAVRMSATVTDKGVSLALGRLTGSGAGGGGGKGLISPDKVARTAAHGMVHEFLPDVFYSNLYNWKKTIRPGMPLVDTGTHLVSAFVYNVSGAVASIKNLFRYGHVHDKGMTIRAKNVPLLRFKIRGVGWFSKKEVVIPRRRFMYWSEKARAFCLRRVNEMVRKGMKGTA